MGAERPAGKPAGDKPRAERQSDSGAREERPRHVYGPRPVGALLPGITRPAFRKRAPAAAQVMSDWEAIVGPALAGITTPRKLGAGTLTIGCSGPIALELQHLSDVMIARVNAHLGRPLVERLRFVQETPAAVPPPPPPDPAPDDLARVERAVSGLSEGELRDALAALGRAIASRG